MASLPQSDDHLPLDSEDELTKPEVRPGLRAQVAREPPPAAPPAAASPSPSPSPSVGGPDDDDDEVTKVDPKRQQLVQSDALPPDLPDLD
jgi:hypothetical protein